MRSTDLDEFVGELERGRLEAEVLARRRRQDEAEVYVDDVAACVQ